jgi:hypothetical protein
MKLEERRALQSDLRLLDHREAENVTATRTFLPLWTHRVALRRESVVVRGGRGAGKSALFMLLRELRTSDHVRSFFREPQLPDATWIDGFSQLATRHPGVESLDAFAVAADDVALRAFWMTHLLRRLREELPDLAPPAVGDGDVQEIAQWVGEGREKMAAVGAALDQIDRELTKKKQIVFATYDHLDRIGMLAFETRRRYIRALLALWLSLSNRYASLRAKIFLREDLFDANELAFPDATKLRARSVSLEWDVEALYQVVVRHLSETSDAMRRWLREVEGLTLEDRMELGWMPGPMPEAVQKAFADGLAGELMGRGVKKGYTYRWIPNRLQDSQVRIVPRSILCLLGVAARTAASRSFPADSTRLLTPEDLAAALPETSTQRVAEIGEEYPLVRRLENLRGLQVMLDPAVVAKQLGKPVAGELPSKMPGEAVKEELIRLGVLSVRRDGRIDVPDIYRYGFGIKRKGGVARPT